MGPLGRRFTRLILFLLLANAFIFVYYLRKDDPDSNPEFLQRKRPKSTGHAGRATVEAPRQAESKSTAQRPDGAVRAPPGPVNPVHRVNPFKNSSSVGSVGSYTDILLTKPQQDFNFHHEASTAIWNEQLSSSTLNTRDRILGQMRFRPANIHTIKTLLVMSGERPDAGRLKRDNCPVTECEIVSDRSRASSADGILWQHHISMPRHRRPPNQIWIAFFLESPYHTPGLAQYRDLFNWTATYRQDSTIVAPYERFTLYDEFVYTKPLEKNYAAGKTKMVAWFVSNCGAINNRLGYARKLGEYVGVDIYGGCGSHRCPRHQANDCFKLLSKQYKFYLAFENSNCQDYISEKFFVNGLSNDVVPIVMGAHPAEYKRAAPYYSYIHVDEFESPKELGDYLKKLDSNDDLYNEYFRWKGTGSNINTFFWCRVCMMLHEADNQPARRVPDINQWWRGPGVCIGRSKDLWPRWVSVEEAANLAKAIPSNKTQQKN